MKNLFSALAIILSFFSLVPVAEARAALVKELNLFFSEQTRPVSGFSGVAAAGSFDVEIKTGATESLRLEGEEEVLNKIETIVENGILKIRTHKNFQNQRINFDKVKVYVTAKALNNLSVSGSGNMLVTDPLQAEVFTVRLSGSGNLTTAAISAGQLIAAVSGSGNITTSGQAKTANVSLSGSGNFNGKKFTTNVAQVQMSGSGNVSIGAEESLNGTLSGSGRIYYSGQAKITEKKSGSGQIIKM